MTSYLKPKKIITVLSEQRAPVNASPLGLARPFNQERAVLSTYTCPTHNGLSFVFDSRQSFLKKLHQIDRPVRIPSEIPQFPKCTAVLRKPCSHPIAVDPFAMDSI